MNGYREELFVYLCPQALNIVSGMLSGVGGDGWQEIAHDITVSFLFFSKSYRETFDRTKDVEPFFRSYVRRCCLRRRDNVFERRVLLSIHDAYVANQCGMLDRGILQFESHDYARALFEVLVDKFYYARRFTLSLQDLFLLSIESFTLYGKANAKWMSEQLGDCSVNIVKFALDRMREVLRERIQNEAQDFYWLLAGAD